MQDSSFSHVQYVSLPISYFKYLNILLKHKILGT